MKIRFIQDNSFLRTAGKTNPFFDPIVRVCEKNGIEWKVLLPAKPAKCGYDKLHIGYYTAFLNIGVWFWRFVHLIWRQPVWKVYELYGKLARLFFGRQLKADLYITIAGNLAEQLAGLFPNARVIDIQHGVIYSGHQGYFDKDKRLIEQYQLPSKREFWVFGQGYADCFFKNPENAKDLEGRVKIIGDVVRAGAQVEGCRLKVEGGEKVGGLERNLVVMSLQLTDDLDQEEKAGSVKVMEEFFSEFFKKYGDKYTVLFKHHPRFNNCYNLSEFYKKFPQIKESKAPWGELYPKMAMHLTFNSTSIFDCAAVGIPTFLLDLPGAKVCHRDLYRDDFGYPLYDKNVDEILDKQEECGKISLEWYRRCYAPFDEENCLKLLKGEV